MSGKNILLVWDRMGDYHRARWAAFSNVMPGIKVFGADLGGEDRTYGWNDTEQSSDYIQLSPLPLDQFDIKRIFRFTEILSKHHIGCVCIAGYGRLEYILFILYGKLTRRKVILFAESWYATSIFKDFVKSIFLKFFCDGFLVSGSLARDHFLKRFGIDPNRIRTGYSVVDNAHFSKAPNSSITQAKSVLLCVARFAREKNISMLISAFKQSVMPQHGWQLNIVGGGQLHQKLKAMADNNIELLPWQTHDRMPQVYATAKIFVLPSIFEPWGLVVNEAMAAQLPIVLSDAVGSSPDLLGAENGWSFKSTDANGLTSVLNSICLLSDEAIDKMGEFSLRRIGAFSLTTFALNLKYLVQG